jgi:hypothetical protein
MLMSAVAKLLTVKAAATVAAVAIVGGGVALAANSGALPLGLGTGNAPAQAAAGTPGPTPTPHGRGQRPDDVPAPSLVGLCRAYDAAVADNPGHALDNPAFGALIAAAHGRDNVQDYCTDLLEDQPRPDEAGRPDDAPGVRPTPGSPSSHPTGPPPANPRVTPTRPSPGHP